MFKTTNSFVFPGQQVKDSTSWTEKKVDARDSFYETEKSERSETLREDERASEPRLFSRCSARARRCLVNNPCRAHRACCLRWKDDKELGINASPWLVYLNSIGGLSLFSLLLLPVLLPPPPFLPPLPFAAAQVRRCERAEPSPCF